VRVEHLREDKEKKEREEVVKEKDRAISARQFQVDFEQSEESFHLEGSAPSLPRMSRRR
jgi:hypothetical protein